ncbi:methylmalonyl-CoA mutase family protein [Enhygromyxa salina]|uniref:Methylmalonyl-CoA mutase small subunit n=1 Tax=Enhygromyxa salina TaxID=215803 RepID=A0A2S9YTP1_9BACT|nr:methylmalonyl-CoA mutase family protein [Enhygromyxa salina]PRQ08409.1 Methylmalonyl-CoA mutase small subunit [Enhygromyxa salina]
MSYIKFSPVTRAQWEAKANDELKGRPLASLTRTTADGIEVPPLYLRDDDARAPRQLPASAWMSVQEYRHVDPRAANAAARRDLELGAGGAWFTLDSELRAGREPGAQPDGLVCDAFEQLDVLLDGIDPAATPVFFDAGLLAPIWADALEEWLDAHSDDAGQAMTVELGRGPSCGGVIYDPISALIHTGSLEQNFEGALTRLSDAILGMRTGLLGVSTCGYHAGGASDAEELALALATCAELLRRGAGLGLEIADLASAMLWTLPIAGRPFEAIAKLRAARVLWAKFTKAAGHEHAELWIHATSSARTWTRHGSWVNLLRGTVGSFAAATGGANSIATAAFDDLVDNSGGPTRDDVNEVERLGHGSELGRRHALNTQLILREEAHLGRVIDPAAGSWYVESLTDGLARAAWTRFRQLERSGGLVANLCSGAIQRSIAASAERLRVQVATRRQGVTGVSTYPALDEPPASPRPSHTFAAGSESRPHASPDQARLSPVLDPAEIAPVPRLRLAAPFERLRDASAAWASKHGAPPRIYSCNLGSIAGFQARADFAANSFLAGGIEIVASEGFATDDPERLHDSVRAGLQASGCSLALICGQDRDYAQLVAPLLVSLRAAGAGAVWVAGRPPRDHDWGLDPELPPRYLFAGGDLLEELEYALRELGVISTGDQERA